MSENTAAARRLEDRGDPPTEERSTRQRLLDAGIDEFCQFGLRGASTARIVADAGCNIRMLYHYFGNKDGLYRAALIQVYEDLRAAEHRQDFWSGTPTEGVLKMVHFTFDYMTDNRRFPKMILAENMAGGDAVTRAREPYEGARTLITNLDALIRRGHESGEFRARPAALDLYLTILSLSFIHISNQHTLSATFGQDLGAPTFIAQRRSHAVDVVMGYLWASTPG